jgi:hypothetical protein
MCSSTKRYFEFFEVLFVQWYSSSLCKVEGNEAIRGVTWILIDEDVSRLGWRRVPRSSRALHADFWSFSVRFRGN